LPHESKGGLHTPLGGVVEDRAGRRHRLALVLGLADVVLSNCIGVLVVLALIDARRLVGAEVFHHLAADDAVETVLHVDVNDTAVLGSDRSHHVFNLLFS